MQSEKIKNDGRERTSKGGRPVKGAAEKLKYRITVKMATEDYYLLKSKAKSAGVSASEFIRGCIKNGGVKERLANIGIPLTMYVSRHSWASAAKNKNIPVSVISEGMGHDSKMTTQIYLASLDNAIVDNANARILRDL